MLRSGSWIVGALVIASCSGEDATTKTDAGEKPVEKQVPPVGIARLEPSRGPRAGGTVLVLRGYNFTPTVKVSFDGVDAADVTVTDAQTLSLTTPSGDGKDAVDVVLTNSDGATATFAKGFRYEASDGAALPPSVQQIAPNGGPASGGTVALLQGDAFQQGGVVVIGGRPARAVTFVDAKTLTIVLPEGQIGTAKVAVTNPDGRSGLLLNGFAYYDAAAQPGEPPQLHSVAPADGPTSGGQAVKVKGAKLDDRVLAFLAGVPLKLDAKSATGLEFVTPPGKRGLAPLAVTNPDGRSTTLADAYNFFQPPPVVRSLSPAFGPATASTEVKIAGSNFAEGATLTVGGVAVTVMHVVSAELIEASLPARSTGGDADLVVLNPDGLSGTLARGFRYTDEANPPPGDALNLVRLLPSSGSAAGGSTISAFGAGFGTGLTVKVNGTLATNVTVRGATAASFVTPRGEAGPAEVLFEMPGGRRAILPRGFFYFETSTTGAGPTVRTVAPSVSPSTGGGLVLISGTGFRAGARVFFGQEESRRVRFNDATSLSSEVPAAGPSIVDVTVVNPDGRAGVLPAAFVYVALDGTPGPHVTSVTPEEVSAASGGRVEINGDHFSQGVTVFVDGASVRVIDSTATKISIEVPPGATGSAEIVITNDDGQSVTVPGAFDYAQLSPTISAILPAIGPVTGNVDATITGSEFLTGAQVFVGGLAAATDVLGPTAIRITVPAGQAGFVDVTVRNPDNQSGTLPGAFEYREGYVPSPRPVLSAVLPPKGPAGGGTRALVQGENFAQGMSITIGGRTANTTVISETRATITTPGGAIGPNDVVATNPDGQFAVVPRGFEYLDPATLGAPPALSGVTPNHGPESARTALYVTGAAFQKGAIVFVGDLPADDTLWAHAALVRCTATPQPAGEFDVSLTNPDGQTATLSRAYRFDASPKLSGLVPDSGPTSGGTRVVVSGTGLRAGAVLTFGGVRSPSVNVLSATVVEATAPAGAAGRVDVKLADPDGQTSTLPQAFTYISPPRVTSVTPATGPATGGSIILITGTDFDATARVKVGENAATVDESSPTALVITTPAGATGDATIVVENVDGQKATAPIPFRYVNPSTLGTPPRLLSVVPVKGPAPGGTYAVMNGSAFQQNALLLIGSSALRQPKIFGATVASGVTGPGVAGRTVRASITNPDGQSFAISNAFKYLAAADLPTAPRFDNVVPGEGSTFGGDTAEARGANFTSGSFVLISGMPQDSAVNGGAKVSFIAGPGPLGKHTVVLTTGEGQSTSLADAWEYIIPPPVITAVTPRTGFAVGGTRLTITGRNFQVGAGVTVGGKPAASANVKSPTSVEIVTPVGSDGPAAIVLTNLDTKQTTLIGGDPAGFTYVAGPRVDAITPTSGPVAGNTPVTITGAFFRSGAVVKIGGVVATEVVLVSATVITAKTPVGTAGPGAVEVTNTDTQTHALTGGFTYLPPIPPPSITAVAPDSGTVVGGTTVVITGTGFQSGATVTFGTARATSVNVLSPTAAVCTTPGNAAGAVKVTLKNPDGQEAAKLNAYTYADDPSLPALAVASINPNVGGPAGGTDVVIGGRGIKNGAAVTIGGVAATNVVWLGPTAISARTGARAAALVDVVVTNPDGQTATLTNGYRYGAAGRFIIPKQRLPPESTGAKASAVLIDYDKDGDTDVVIDRETGNYKPWVYRNDGGYFVDATALAIPTWPSLPGYQSRDMLAGDLDGDGDDDIVLVRDGGVRYLLRNDAGVFTLVTTSFPSGGPSTVVSGAIADVTGDGKLDVILPGWNEEEVIYVNNGGTPPTFTVRRFGLTDPTAALAVGDVDRDGDIDIFTANASDQQKQLYLNNGTGIFTRTTPGVNVPILAGNSWSVVMRDFNKDGNLDVIIGNDGQQDRLLLNNGAGIFADATAGRMPVEIDNTQRVFPVDVDLDGDWDLVAVRNNGRRDRIYLNDGTATFADVTANNLPSNLSEFTVQFARTIITNPATLTAPQDAVRWDLSGDGQPDLFQVNDVAQNRFLKNLGGSASGKFIRETMTVVPEENDDVSAARAIDLDGDGDIDVVKAVANKPLKLLFNDGAGNLFDLSSGRSPSVNLLATELLVDDMDKDGDADIVIIQTSPAQIVMFQNDGTGTFTDVSASRLPASNRTLDYAYGGGFIDFDRDGRKDLLIGHQYSQQTIRLWRNVGPGSFLDITPSQLWPIAPPSSSAWYVRDIGSGDFDGDGWEDMIVARDNGYMVLLKNNGGNGTFGDVTSTNMPSPPPGREIIVAKLDADADLDLYVVNQGNDRLRVNNGAGVFSDTTSGSLPAQVDTSCSGAVVDADDDGQLDIILAKNDSCGTNSFTRAWNGRQPRLHINLGNATFGDSTASRLPVLDDNGEVVLTADFDGDGKKDILLLNNGQSRMLVWRP